MLEEEKTTSLVPFMTAIFFILLVIYLFSQDASLAGPF